MRITTFILEFRCYLFNREEFRIDGLWHRTSSIVVYFVRENHKFFEITRPQYMIFEKEFRIAWLTIKRTSYSIMHIHMWTKISFFNHTCFDECREFRNAALRLANVSKNIFIYWHQATYIIMLDWYNFVLILLREFRIARCI